MKLKLIEHIKLTKELVDREYFFSVGYCEAIETHLMKVLVSWVAGYERYYRISAEDYALFEKDRPAFYELYKTSSVRITNALLRSLWGRKLYAIMTVVRTFRCVTPQRK